MHQFVYPAVFYKDSDSYLVLFPDFNLYTYGETIEEAMLFAKDCLRVYCSKALKFEGEVVTPSTYNQIKEKYSDGIVMLLDTLIDMKKINK